MHSSGAALTSKTAFPSIANTTSPTCDVGVKLWAGQKQYMDHESARHEDGGRNSLTHLESILSHSYLPPLPAYLTRSIPCCLTVSRSPFLSTLSPHFDRIVYALEGGALRQDSALLLLGSKNLRQL